ncbi:MAG: hypothetical protein H7A38_00515 [Chlamydiales bacterium]|nr:hypothetical protein [Chlamydiales bacterium]
MKNLAISLLGIMCLFAGMVPAYSSEAELDPPLTEDVAMLCPNCGKYHKPTTKCPD